MKTKAAISRPGLRPLPLDRQEPPPLVQGALPPVQEPPPLVEEPAPAPEEPAPAPEEHPLPDYRQKQVEAGLAYHQQVQAERDELKHKLDESERSLAGMKIQIDSLLGIVSMMEETIKTYRAERDQTVRLAAKLEVAMENIYSLAQKAVDAMPLAGQPRTPLPPNELRPS